MTHNPKVRSVLTTLVTQQQGEQFGPANIDVNVLVFNLLMYDHTILQTTAFRDIARLAQVLGTQQMIDLLESETISIDTKFDQVGQFHQAANEIYPRQFPASGTMINGVRPFIPFNHLDPVVVSLKPDDYINHAALEINKLLDPTDSNTKRLIRSVKSRVYQSPDFAPQGYSLARATLLQNNGIYNLALKQSLKALHNLNVPVNKLESSVETYGSDGFRVQSNVRSLIALSDLDEHNLHENAFLAVCGYYLMLSKSFSYKASPTIRTQDVHLINFDRKTRLAEYTEADTPDAFTRILKIGGIPQLAADQYFDVNKLLNLRASGRLVEFQKWLYDSSDKTAEEIKRELTSIRSNLGTALRTAPSKVALALFYAALPSFLNISGIENLALCVAAEPLGAILLNALFPDNAAISFINDNLKNFYSQ